LRGRTVRGPATVTRDGASEPGTSEFEGGVMTQPIVVVHRDATVLADAVAARLITRLVDVQAARDSASVVLTGGGVGVATLAAIAESPARAAVDWSRLDVWWGDERYLPPGHADRNETQAREALLDR